MWDAIVIGSGIGGLAAAAALGKRGWRVLMLEQHAAPGGLTQTFRRQDWSFATGVHYVGGVGDHPGANGQFGRLLGWLSDGELRFAPLVNPYDIVRLPGFEFGIAHPETAYRDALWERFPSHNDDIDRWFDACAAARDSTSALFSRHYAPAWLAAGVRLLRGAPAEHWAGVTLAEQLAMIREPRLRAVLGARWADHGAPPASAPFLEHALVTGSYNAGAYYPVGGPARFAEALLPALRAAGGEVRLQADVRRILVERGHAVGVVYGHGDETCQERGRCVISAMGVANTVDRLEAGAAKAWQATVRAMKPGLSHISLFLGFEGDIASAGASSANVWVYESEDVGRVWQAPTEEDAPGMFVTFPSLKDPSHTGRPTAEVVVPVDARAFEPWLHRHGSARTEGYRLIKERIERRLVAQVLRHFPALEPLLRFHEMSTPLTQQRYVRTPNGSMYGMELSAERLTSSALHVRTPLRGLLLAGQDVFGPGVQSAFMGGLIAAASVEPALWPQLLA